MSKSVLLIAVLSLVGAVGCSKNQEDKHHGHSHSVRDGGSPQPNTVSDKPSTRPGQMQMGK